MSKPNINPEVAAKYSCTLGNPKFNVFGKQYNLETITVAQVDELVANGVTCFVLKQKAVEPKEAKPKA